MDQLGLAKAIAQLRSEVAEAIRAGVGEPLQFALGPIEVELQLQLAHSADVNAGLKWVVVSVGGDVKTSTTQTHKVRFTLTPLLDGGPVKVKDQADGKPG
jgi:hypothetical protein